MTVPAAAGLVYTTMFVVIGPLTASPASNIALLLAVALALIGPFVTRVVAAVLAPLLRWVTATGETVFLDLGSARKLFKSR